MEQCKIRCNTKYSAGFVKRTFTFTLKGLFILVLLLGVSGLEAPSAKAEIVISELMYNPVGTDGGLDGDEFEFAELLNTGLAAVDLTGVSFTAGITYTFTGGISIAAGSYLVLVRNRQAFESRYPDAEEPAPGIYTGRLANSGENIQLENAFGDILFSVEFMDGFGWPVVADGNGSSLVLIDPGEDPEGPENWCASRDFNGTPGEPGTCAVREVVINEVLPHTDPPLEDAIELYNTTGSAMDITGWFLSDSAVWPQKYEIPATVIPAGGYAVFYEYQFNDAGAQNTAFALNSVEGDEVYLTVGDGSGNTIRLVDAVSFDAGEIAVSMGRFPNGMGPVTALASPTFGVSNPSNLADFRTGTGAENSAPKVGPVVINEIMYHPPDKGNPLEDNTEDEYIELHNITDDDVVLYDPENPENTWQIKSAVDFILPGGVTIPARGYVLIVGTQDIAAFRSTYTLPSSAAVYGPWSGKLNNSAEAIKLYKPDEPTDEGVVPYILADRVDYMDENPWPDDGADGDGHSLERKASPGYGGDPDNWQTSPPDGTPARLNGSEAPCFFATAASDPAP
jgi:hypothetical protein